MRGGGEGGARARQAQAAQCALGAMMPLLALGSEGAGGGAVGSGGVGVGLRPRCGRECPARPRRCRWLRLPVPPEVLDLVGLG